MTFNMAFNIQLNYMGGSEAPMVRRCQTAFGDAIQCTRVAAKSFVACGADVICLQEAVKEGVVALVRELHQLTTTRYRYKQCRNAAIVYNAKFHATRVGKRIGYDDRGVREFVAIQIGDTVYASVWLGHLSSAQQFKRAFRTVGQALRDVPYNRIVVGMDSNDYRGLLARKGVTVRIGKHRMYMAAHAARLNTCCEDSNYEYPGDYIMDSDQRIQRVHHDRYHTGRLYGLSPTAGNGSDGDGMMKLHLVTNKHHQLMSDHVPVVYRTYRPYRTYRGEGSRATLRKKPSQQTSSSTTSSSSTTKRTPKRTPKGQPRRSRRPPQQTSMGAQTTTGIASSPTPTVIDLT